MAEMAMAVGSSSISIASHTLQPAAAMSNSFPSTSPLCSSLSSLPSPMSSAPWSPNSRSSFYAASHLQKSASRARSECFASWSGAVVQPISGGWRWRRQRQRQRHSWREEAGSSSVACRASFVSGSGALSPELKAALDNFVGSNKVVLFMKGNRNFPQCGFSNTCIQILNQFQVPYETVNILEDESLRQGVKEYSNWPTYPQLYIDGEFYGGCDIALEAYHSGELKEALDKALVS